ncbi:hypothetical protein EXIGLDRAFT_764740 [Exidia glandulosa HHB12029]|uniref:Uncharacterized protein n=1 Tax=Exidia glandulosa HHB12029 TaxID=1314781 RepID=A0A165KZY3_EXIGL|nr:hypothetical protein EXIGLDRAFT_764740 [Exidia glandulosa HHB12029]
MVFNIISRRAFSTSARIAAPSLGQSVKNTVAGVASMFKNDGAIGSKFEKGGEVAEVGEAVGGPFKSDGAIGRQFSAKEGGVVGGTGQAVAKAAKEAVEPENKHEYGKPTRERPNAQNANYPINGHRRS